MRHPNFRLPSLTMWLSAGLFTLGCDSATSEPTTEIAQATAASGEEETLSETQDDADDTGMASLGTQPELSPEAEQIQRILGTAAWDFGHADGAPSGPTTDLIANLGAQLAKLEISLEPTTLDSTVRTALIAEYLELIRAKGEPPEALLVLLLQVAEMDSDFSAKEKQLFDIYHAAISPEMSIPEIADIGIQQTRLMQMRSLQSEAPIYLRSIHTGQEAYKESYGEHLTIAPCPDTTTPSTPRVIPPGACPELEKILGDLSWLGELYGSYSFDITDKGITGAVRMDIDGDGTHAIFTINEAGEVNQTTPDDVF